MVCKVLYFEAQYALRLRSPLKTCLENEAKRIIYFWFLRIFTLILKDQK